MTELRGTGNSAIVFVHIEASTQTRVGPGTWPESDVETMATKYRVTLDRVTDALRVAGFEIRNAIVSVNYADGFEPNPGHRESRA